MSVFDAYVRLSGCIAGSVCAEERMSRHTSLRVGGPASLFVTCDTLEALQRANEVLFELGVPWSPLGAGTGVLVSDEGYLGAVVTLGRAFRRFELTDDGVLHAGAAALMQRVVSEALTHGMGGLEFASGLPGTLGGAVCVNASTPAGSMADVVESVTTLRPGDGLRRYAASDVAWWDGGCSIPAGEVVLEASLRLSPSDAAGVKRRMDASSARLHASAPIGKLTCSALFADPEGASASELMAGCNLAGREEGAAVLYARNPNYAVNRGRARADDVGRLMVTSVCEVRDRYGIELRPKVKFLGF